MVSIQSHRDLLVWQRGMELAERCYEMTRRFPREEMYGLTAQLRRACVSIPSNVAEGHNHGSTAVFVRHLSVALGSQAELETQLELALRLEYVTHDAAQPTLDLAEEVGRMLHGLMESLESRLAARLAPSS